MPQQIVCPDTENDPSQQCFELGVVGGLMCMTVTSSVLTAQQSWGERHHYAHTQIHKCHLQCKNIYVQNSQTHSVRHEKMHACLLAQKRGKRKKKKKTLTKISKLKQSMTLWPLSCHIGKQAVAEAGRTKHNQDRQEKQIIWHTTS